MMEVVMVMAEVTDNIMVVNEVTNSAVVNGAYDVMTNHTQDVMKEPKAVYYDHKLNNGRDDT